MPKKFVGENSKAVAARQRKAASKEAEQSKKQQEIEDAYWQDDDKHIAKKMQRKEENERKKQQQLEKKAEKKALLEQEMNSIKKSAKTPAVKLTRAQIQAEAEKQKDATKISEKTKPKAHVEQPIEENINRTQPEEVASTIDEALKMLCISESSSEDKHPEKRLKAAYLAFEEKNLPILKQENPTLRMSQLKQMLFKEWLKSRENPLNKQV